VESNRSEGIVYLTLVDFLIQLIFLGVFVTLILYSSNTNQEQGLTEKTSSARWPIIEGLGELVHEDNIPLFEELGRLLENREDLKELVSLLDKKNTSEIAEILVKVEETDRDAKIEKRGGFVPCEGEFTGKFPQVMKVTTFAENIRIDEITPKGRQVFNQLSVQIIAPSVLSWPEFLKVTKIFASMKKDGYKCRYKVDETSKSDSRQAFTDLWSRFWFDQK
jgi:hypothetical protein